MKKLLVVLSLVFWGIIARADTFNQYWYNESDLYAQTTCQTGGDITLPTAPTKYGYDFIGWEKSPYIPIEYLGSTGSQWIDTGINGTQVTKFVIKGVVSTNGDMNSQLIGGTSGDSTTFFGARNINQIKYWYCIDSNGNSLGDPTHVSVVSATIENNMSQYGTLFDTETNQTMFFEKFSNSWAFASENLLLFGGAYSRRSPNAKCYYLKLYNQNGLVFDGIPVKRASDNMIGMFDFVSGQFFTNAGTGDFIAGPEIGDLQ